MPATSGPSLTYMKQQRVCAPTPPNSSEFRWDLSNARTPLLTLGRTG
jgi:hypothetical protein